MLSPGEPAVRGRLRVQFRHDVVADVEVRVDVLHVVAVLERVDQAEHLAGALGVQRHGHRRQEARLGRLVVVARVLQRLADRDQVGRLGHDLEAVAEVVDLLGARVEHGEQHVVLAEVTLGDDHDALAVEHVRHRARVGHVAAVAGHRGADLAGRAVAVVGQALDEHGDPVGSVALVRDRLPVGAAGLLARATFAGPLDVVRGHGGLPCLLDRVVERRVAVRITPAGARGDLDVLDQLREQLAALGIEVGLLVLGGGPLGVAAHVSLSIIRTNNSCTRPSPVSSGWNAVARTLPCRTATILPAATPATGESGTVANTVTWSAADSTQGALMKTACTGPPATSAKSRSSSNESTCRPKALRRTTMSSAPSWCWSGRPSRSSLASRIIPAHEP